jgi:uncharacterized delta-60 repeat protein
MGASDDYAYAVAVQPDGNVLVAGSRYEHLGDFAILRLTRDGAPDPTFGNGGMVFTDFGSFDSAYAIAVQADGKIVAAGTTTVQGSSFDFAVARYLPDGTPDTSFSDDGRLTTALGTDIDIARAIAIQPNGRIVVGGYTNRGTSSTGLDFALVRYMGDGSLDPTWGTGVVITPMKANAGTDIVYGLALQQIDSETRVVAVGGDGDFIIARYRENGALDTTFGSGGKIVGLYGSVIGSARAVVAGSSGELYVAGHAQGDFALVKLTQAGQVDSTFGKVTTAISATKSDEANAVALDGNQVIAAGWVSEPDSSAGNFAVTRYAATGHLDTEFGNAGIVITPMATGTKPDVANAMALQIDERVPTVRAIVAGNASNTDNDFAIARYWR